MFTDTVNNDDNSTTWPFVSYELIYYDEQRNITTET